MKYVGRDVEVCLRKGSAHKLELQVGPGPTKDPLWAVGPQIDSHRIVTCSV